MKLIAVFISAITRNSLLPDVVAADGQVFLLPID